tara:strand:- start:2123 stop:2971 length:849 start_codon:yes stop_codon:yes gene_type:complete
LLIASWNVNSIRSRLSQVINWIKEKHPDVLCLQETKVSDKDFPAEAFLDLGYKVKFYGQKSYNGVAIISKSNLSDIRFGFNGELNKSDISNIFTEQKRIISALIDGIRVINVYVPNGSSLNSEKFKYKIDWLEKLNEYLIMQEQRGEYTCLLGDFNIALDDKDIHNPEKYSGNIMASEIERSSLKELLGERFIDSFRVFEKFSGHWSWWDYRNNSFELNKGWRIDHIYISNNLLSNLKSSVIETDQRANIQPSDHAPVMVNLNLNGNINIIDDDDDDDIFDF